MEHYIEKCKTCDKVISQCRCINHDKFVKYGFCEDCKNSGSSSPTKETLKREFEEKFSDSYTCSNEIKIPFNKNDILDFFLSKFDEVLSSLQEEVGKSKKEVPLGLTPEEHEEIRAYNSVYNQALDKVSDIIKSHRE